jgi:hypothetical protein
LLEEQASESPKYFVCTRSDVEKSPQDLVKYPIYLSRHWAQWPQAALLRRAYMETTWFKN